MKPTPAYNDNFVNKIRRTRKHQKNFEYFVLFIASILIFKFFGNLWVETGAGKSPFTPTITFLVIGFLFGLGKEATGKKRDDFRIKTYYRLINFYVEVCKMSDNENTRNEAQKTIKNYGEDEIHSWLNECDRTDRIHGREALLTNLYPK